MTTKDEALAMALDALEGLFQLPAVPYGGVAVWRLGGSHAPQQAIAAIKAALAQEQCPHGVDDGVDDGACKECYMAQPKQEPYTWIEVHPATGRTRVVLPGYVCDADATWKKTIPLFAGSAPINQEPYAWANPAYVNDPSVTRHGVSRTMHEGWIPLYTGSAPT